MSKMIKGRTPLLVLILFVFAIGQSFADPAKVVVIPMAADLGISGYEIVTKN